MPEVTPGPLRFRFGVAGAVAPLALFLAGVISLALAGAPDERGFWPVLLAALAVGLLLARDRRAYAEAVVGGMARPLVALMILAWIVAGVLAALMSASGFIPALTALAAAADLGGGSFCAAAFVVACVVSTATGTSLGTLVLCAPLLYPAGVAVGASPAVLMGALLGGATFGDNISPVSDTTIASAGTQDADLGGVVKSRLRYALPAAAVALVAYAWAGAGGAGTPQGPGVELDPGGLALLAAPGLTLALLLARRHLLEGLFAGVAAAAGLGLALGRFTPADLLRVEPGAFRAQGLLLDGIERGIGVSVFTLLLAGLVAGLESSGILDRAAHLAAVRARTPLRAEVAMVAAVSVAVVLTTHSVVAILAVGPFARRAGERAGIGAYRRANLLDLAVCVFPFILPYCIPTVLAASTTAGSPSAPRLDPLTVGLHNFHSWALLGMLALAVATGWGRGPIGATEADAEPAGEVG